MPPKDGWDIRFAIVPIKLTLRSPDFHSINRFNRALGIAPFTDQTLLTYGSEVGVYIGERFLLSLSAERGELQKASTNQTQYREISIEMERQEFRIEYLNNYKKLEWSLGAFTALGTISMRSKLQNTDGGPVVRPIGTLDANLLIFGPKVSAAFWVNAHLNLSLNFTYSVTRQYNQPTNPPANLGDPQTAINSLQYSDLGLGIATTVRF